jgi:spore coat protein U-like protein
MKFQPPIKSVFSAAGIGVLALGLGSNSAFAATATTTFSVTANVVSTCAVSATTAAFGPYTGTTTDTTATVTVTCSNLTTYNVGLSAGLATGATVTTRAMTGPSATLLNYGLFQDSAHSVNWGDTVGTDTVAGTGNGLGQSLTVYGQVPAGQFVESGAYTDTITATVTY